MLLPAHTVTQSSTHARRPLHCYTRACLCHKSYWLLHQPTCWCTKDVDWQAAESYECSSTHHLEHPEVRPWSDESSTRRSTLAGRQWSRHVQTVCPGFPVLTRHGAIVPVWTVPVGVWRTSSAAVIWPQSARRTSLQPRNRRQTCVWLGRSESMERITGLSRMQRTESQKHLNDI